ncbi:hypothetical protein V474_07535 [Novosphingobium barchaimii LL02]|uniref:Uncharacterized protein n=2 Tax=Novosphingobium barchaimii TaxID=1420591 RepID=A0A0J7Y7N8_9SPHN|nr:hypothetical protein V474_07535 [Novosphingobium barchaimii LL02]
MFDYVRSQIALPDGFTGELQSKDFDCYLSVLEIREGGTLWIERFETEEVPLAERPYPEADDWRSFIGSERRINERWEQIEFHGDMNFYGTDADMGWHEYTARFSNGNLDWIKQISPAGEGAGS